MTHFGAMSPYIYYYQLLKFFVSKVYKYPTDELHEEFNLLKAQDISKQEVLTFVFNFFLGGLPIIFKNYYETFADNHDINTRNANLNIRKIRRNNNFGAKCIKTIGADLWNDLSIEIRKSSNTKQFRSNYRKFILPYHCPI